MRWSVFETPWNADKLIHVNDRSTASYVPLLLLRPDDTVGTMPEVW